MRKLTKNNLITFGGTAVLLIVLGILMMNGMLNNMTMGLMVTIGIYIIASISLNLTVGVLGELSLGHAGFMCIGAFSSATVSQMLLNVGGLPAWLA
ncbi:MAG: branched-chain amino acid ABC transporter permease, partial [Oscillospiraceae bacterium]|nr:branched-chain amino acid ABC transporter permease [Oscillospiraceae bacterium]